jgi:hypothetical protein
MGLPVEQRNQYAWGALGLASRCYAGLWDAAARKTAHNAICVARWQQTDDRGLRGKVTLGELLGAAA